MDDDVGRMILLSLRLAAAGIFLLIVLELVINAN